MDYWERKDQKTQLEHLNKRQRLASGGVVQVDPGMYAEMNPGDTMRKDEQGNRIYTPADQPPPPAAASQDPVGSDERVTESGRPARPNILHGIQTN